MRPVATAAVAAAALTLSGVGWAPAAVAATPLVPVVLTATQAPLPGSLVCNHRSFEHVKRHGGYKRDSRWHVEHGERPTCQPDDGDSNGKRDDGRRFHHHGSRWHFDNPFKFTPWYRRVR